MGDLIAQHERAYDVLLRASARAQRGMRTERRVWTFLVVLALSWGILTGLSVALAGFFLDPVTAFFGCFATVGLVATVRLHGSSR